MNNKADFKVLGTAKFRHSFKRKTEHRVLVRIF